MRQKLFVGNWKMNGNLVANGKLLRELKAGVKDARGEVAVCVPSCYLAQCCEILIQSDIALGAQDVSSHAIGAYTGDISARMLQDFGCKYVIVGHSERREYHGETDEEIAHKAQRAMAAGLTPIVCVGETLSQKEAKKTQEVIERQMSAFLSVLEPEETNNLIVAYEPVWAIGTGKTATPEMAQEAHALLRELLVKKSAEAGKRTRILYGGSMRPNNAKELLKMPDIDGGLIGGASLIATDFIAITKAVL